MNGDRPAAGHRGPQPFLVRGMVRTLLRQVALLIAASVLVFALTRLLPQTPMEAYLQHQGLPVTREAVEALRHQWGLDGSWLHQYGHWAGGFVTGNWGVSLVSGEAVAPELLSRVPASMTIGLGSLLLGAVAAYVLGVTASTWGGVFDVFSRALTIIEQAVPGFMACVIVINLVGVKWGWVSFYRLSGPGILVAPTLVMAFLVAGPLSRVVAAHVDQLRVEPFIQAGLERGVSFTRLAWTDGWRPSVYGLVSAMISRMASVLGGAAVVEYVFAVPGMSYLLISSIADRDYSMVQGYLMIMVIWMLIARGLLQIVLSALDPRAR